MDSHNHILVNRKLFEHPFWDEERIYSRFEAWLDLLQSAKPEDAKQLTGNRFTEIKQGELAVSLRHLAKRWRWSKHKVDNFFDLLITDKLIRKGTAQGTAQTIIIICNYERYNSNPENGGQQKGQDGDTPGTHHLQAGIDEIKAEFDRFRKLYPGTKMGLNTEFENFKKKNPDYPKLVFFLYPALESLLEWRRRRRASGRFVPEMANLQTWINQKRWEVELENTEESNEHKEKQKPIDYYTFD